ncbi:MAG: 5,10-methylenetetrahydrofolate reductase [Deltaproteobacteria bacterium]|nr:methylenetetrahydrofolate reductase [Deltaproteobacteria bacterium]OQY15812.1 MAG: 5,10-methylenetetrahydrofolate reductase [Desulfobacterium sp. 4572_20]HDH87257.1 5,10-methylenetetrahydrofolate reductase [Desulfobacteraceae bacterium]MCD6264785.1 methylenetetrahydrofolate reductase [Deltaproteobacteria bacterium]RLB14590.1 MAG: 5,10-methylenetetrahydrofolate reductase [Deltaproteobacteria bacterium]
MSFQKRLVAGDFVVLAEFDPPKGVDASDLVSNLIKIKGRVDGVIVPEMAQAVMRMSAMGGAALMEQHGMETIMQICSRDRNRLALQGDVLAAYFLGIKNLLVVPGEEIMYGDHIDAKQFADIDELTLLRAIKGLQNGVDMAGMELKGSPKFLTGCSIKPAKNEIALEAELELTQKKVKEGAQFLVTPPVFNINAFTYFMEKAKGLGIPVIATVFLLKSVGVARYISTNVPGPPIPEEMISRLRKAPDRINECINIAGELITSLKELCQGVQLVTMGWENRLPAILDAAKI